MRIPTDSSAAAVADGPASGRATTTGRGRGARWLRRLLVTVLAVLVLACAGFGVLWQMTPGVGDLGQRVDARLAAHGATNPQALPEPDRVGQALVATEDSRFFSHPGVDTLGAVRGLVGALAGNADAGGATLDQQLAKVIYTPEQTDAIRKVEQVVLAVKIDGAYSKEQILQTYLASVYFGHGYYGLPAASRGYFGVAPAELTWAQASVLAGLVQAPSAYDPVDHFALAKQRQRHVLDRLVATGVLTNGAADAAFSAPLGLRG